MAEADESRMGRTYCGYRLASILPLRWHRGAALPDRHLEANAEAGRAKCSAKEECPGKGPGASVALSADGV